MKNFPQSQIGILHPLRCGLDLMVIENHRSHDRSMGPDSEARKVR